MSSCFWASHPDRPNVGQGTWKLYAVLETFDTTPGWEDLDLVAVDILNYMHKNVPRRTRLPPGNGVVLFTSMSDACVLAALHHQDANARRAATLVASLDVDFFRMTLYQDTPHLIFDSFSKVAAPVNFIVARNADDVNCNLGEIGRMPLKIAVSASAFRTGCGVEQMGSETVLTELLQPIESK
ncbi:unnamed protein product, partial [Symbiodinium pilosum]